MFTPQVIVDSSGHHAVVQGADVHTELVFDSEGTAEWTAPLDLRGAAVPVIRRYSPAFRWAGQQADEETELHYNRYRYYDPTTDHYLSRDPLGLRGGLRQFSYPADPFARADPLGLAAVVIGETQAAVDEATSMLRAAGRDVESMMVPNNQWRGGRLYPGMPDSEFQRAVDWNRDWLAEKIRSGYHVVDIGEDAARTSRSAFYLAEQEALSSTRGSGHRMRLRVLPGGESVEDMRERLRGGCRA